MEQTWRWFGETDPIPIHHVRQAGATGVVTALHHIPQGTAWTDLEVARRKATIEAAGLRWSVCESIPIPSAIKRGGAGARVATDVWIDSLAALGRAGVPVVCYNFMPVVDWTRTDLLFRLPTTGHALRFDVVDFVAYDVFVLRRRGADEDYAPDVVRSAAARIEAMPQATIDRLERTVIAGLPGGADAHTRASIAAEIAAFDGIDAAAMRSNLAAFLRAIVPVAEAVGVRLAIHPDDPPSPLFGLPRVVSTAADIRTVLAMSESAHHGLTLCAGSLASRAENDVQAIAAEAGARIHFAHLRNVKTEPNGSFHEAEHLDGDVDMVALVERLLRAERRSRAAGGPVLPMRPDHGHLLADDTEKTTNPGYSYIGRLKGLAELRGVIYALESCLAGDPD